MKPATTLLLKPLFNLRIPACIYCFIFLSVIFATSCSGSKKNTPGNWETITVTTSDSLINKPATSPQGIVNKYAAWLHVGEDTIARHLKLYTFIDQWLNTPYLWGGTTKKGIDCSAFMQRLYNDVYNIQIPRTSVQQFFTNNVEPFHDHYYFSEGDLVFFSTIPGKPISHVGLYLHNNYFVNSSSSKGVNIGSLNDAYWRKRYVAAGRLKLSKTNSSSNKNSK